ncbi:MAG TPA: penicillin-binding protein 2 [Candidatus Acidoferrum sp.]|nr:penicillin-binding protein 2 [Candidatus Acidoferrum sp.]
MSERHILKDLDQERRLFLSRLLIGSVIAVALVGVLVARMVFLQVSEHAYYTTKSDSYRIRTMPIAPTRGLIYDRNGVLLADNKPSYNLTVIKENAKGMQESLALLADLINLAPEEVDKLKVRLKRRAVPFSPVPVRMNLNEVDIANIAVNQFRLPGFAIEAQLARHYPQGELLAHALGYIGSISEDELENLDPVNYEGTDEIGKMGVEKFYEDTLHGKVGYEQVEKSASGRIMQVLSRTDPAAGKDLVLYLDSKLQKAASDALGDFTGGVVALDVETGGVLAMVSKPGFDPNLFIGGISSADYNRLNRDAERPFTNRALSKTSPGSTIKPFLGLGALDTGIRTREYTIRDPGHFQLDGVSHVYHDWTWWKDRNGHDIVNLEKAIYQSCDTYFFDLATDMDIDTMHDFLAQFGFGRNSAVDIPQAGSGVLPSRKWKKEAIGQPWYAGETLNSAIGQGYTEVTPLQLATAAMLMANHGKWHQPVMVKRIGLNGEDIARTSDYPDIKLKNDDDWHFIGHAMSEVIHKNTGGYHNTGTAFASITENGKKPLAYMMAGKTGTAQVKAMAADYKATKQNESSIDEEDRDNALFIAFAPVENPKIAVAVFAEHGLHGASAAGPVARAVLDAYLLGEDGQLKPEYRPPAVATPVLTASAP